MSCKINKGPYKWVLELYIETQQPIISTNLEGCQIIIVPLYKCLLLKWIITHRLIRPITGSGRFDFEKNVIFYTG